MTTEWTAVDRALALMAARPERERLRPSELIRAVRALPAPPGGEAPGEQWPARMRTVCRRLIRQGQYARAVGLLDMALPAWDPDPTVGLHALGAHARTSLTGHPVPDLVDAASAALQGADRALDAGDLDVCAELVVIGAGLLLHRDLHADVERSPLADDTAAFLAPFRASRAMAALAAPRGGPGSTSADVTDPRGHVTDSRSDVSATAPASDEDGQQGTGQHRRRVVVLPGAYPRFSGALVDELRRRPDLDVEVVELIADHPSFRWLGTDPDLVRLRLTGGPWPTDPDETFAVTPEQLAAVQGADVVVADWADKGAVWASLVVPRSTRLVVRVHGMDTFGLWPHAIDWSQVDALVAVSPHQGEVALDVLRHSASRAAPPPLAVVPNIVRLPPVPDPPRRDPHALVLVGWANRVKDPLWAVEVLAGLLARGDDWSLVLVGDGFRPGSVLSSQAYASAFAERAARPDVAAHIRHVPQTDDVAREVARVGFVLSASNRESFHQGFVEGVLGGAVPVVRNWPFFARRDGARRLYPPAWVADDVEAAVERIWALRAEGDRSRAAEEALAEVRRRFDPERVGEHLVDVILGESAST